MAKLTQSQMRKIYALAKEKGLDTDLLHVYLESVTGKDSLRKLTGKEAILFIDTLEGKTGKATDRATYRQMNYIYGLMKKLGWVTGEGNPDTDRLDGFLKSQYGTGSYKWLDKKTAGKCIEAFKDMSERPERMSVI